MLGSVSEPSAEGLISGVSRFGRGHQELRAGSDGGRTTLRGEMFNPLELFLMIPCLPLSKKVTAKSSEPHLPCSTPRAAFLLPR